MTYVHGTYCLLRFLLFVLFLFVFALRLWDQSRRPEEKKKESQKNKRRRRKKEKKGKEEKREQQAVNFFFPLGTKSLRITRSSSLGHFPSSELSMQETNKWDEQMGRATRSSTASPLVDKIFAAQQ